MQKSISKIDKIKIAYSKSVESSERLCKSLCSPFAIASDIYEHPYHPPSGKPTNKIENCTKRQEESIEVYLLRIVYHHIAFRCLSVCRFQLQIKVKTVFQQPLLNDVHNFVFAKE